MIWNPRSIRTRLLAVAALPRAALLPMPAWLVLEHGTGTVVVERFRR